MSSVRIIRSLTRMSSNLPPRSCSHWIGRSPCVSRAVINPMTDRSAAATSRSLTLRAIIVRVASLNVASAPMVAAVTWRRSVITAIAGEPAVTLANVLGS